MCALCRPYDNQTFTRIHLETVALELILSAVEKERFQLQWSPVHYQEISATANDSEREELLLLMEKTKTSLGIDQKQARKRAETFVSHGVGVANAAHVAYAESMKADFITCDDKTCPSRIANLDRKPYSILQQGEFTMNPTKLMSDKDLIRKGTEILIKNLGYTEALRFLSMPKEKRMDSVQRHREWQETLDKNDFFERVFTPEQTKERQ